MILCRFNHEDGLLGQSAVWRRHSGKGGIEFCECVSGAECVGRLGLQQKMKTGDMIGVLAQKCRK
jgi:hypothetical protein